jgi:RimJ/RimL family protein N-acetyltransferase
VLVPVTLTDGVVRLRAVEARDIEQIHAAAQDDELHRFIAVPQPYRRRDAEEYVARTRRQWASGEKAAFAVVGTDDDGTLLGVISLSIVGQTGNCGYWVAPEARGQGIARRALTLVTDWAFSTLGLAVVLLEINEQNPASMAVARHAGYHQAGRLDVNTQTGVQGNLIYSRLVADPPPT